ncbi:MAG: hypothetical protein GY925_29185 [Actinomycetia bacterium]|nr:hypothetical protein [Actinomycetes bacterium]
MTGPGDVGFLIATDPADVSSTQWSHRVLDRGSSVVVFVDDAPIGALDLVGLTTSAQRGGVAHALAPGLAGAADGALDE